MERRSWAARGVQKSLGMHTTSASFVPPHGPRSACASHLSEVGLRFTRHSFLRRAASPQRIQWFHHVHGGHAFSAPSDVLQAYDGGEEPMKEIANERRHRLKRAF